MTADFQEQRVKMVDGQVRTTDVTDVAILSAMLDLPREDFVPEQRRPLAYIDEDIEVAPGRYLMEPSPFARLLQLAKIRHTDLVLDVGCGTGYSTAVLSRLASFVVGLESDAELAARAGQTLSSLGCENVSVVEGPLPAGHAEQAPYDVIFVNGAVDELPSSLTDQLKDGGRLVAVLGEGNAGRALLHVKEGGLVSASHGFNAAVRPLPEFRRVQAFQF
ncbi:protein-L-isoaspartate O-methyltransferase [Mesorhizobium microcysteis]|jgi:protein-L-isoaspartate(D-aspartate) O-methyltransferase|uniref:Protein-L-isoaspartate O-methyltransferase n=1 Tax=Neoaquamicrobium microcysteis TaxID=2682781 RepID=A0A5D4GQ45_9HYPH|nr:protein-L-isoaspartate O-methyltransferase [Mesorhizobium microcysteis]TYR30991.1 protein-L-isoaspartate O-methyltransferase [Mesorhizobium microcysteis]